MTRHLTGTRYIMVRRSWRTASRGLRHVGRGPYRVRPSGGQAALEAASSRRRHPVLTVVRGRGFLEAARSVRVRGQVLRPDGDGDMVGNTVVRERQPK